MDTNTVNFDLWICRRWENPVSARYYEARLCQNLFGEWAVRRAWGGLGNRLGGDACETVDSYEEGLAALEKVGKRRKQRGYYPVR
jgi:predicted DNA-binding WGR domain protein